MAQQQVIVSAPEIAGFSEHFLDADGFRIRYLESGTGPTLVHIHGGGGIHLCHAHELLAQQHRLLLLEVPGFGSSAVNERSQTGQDMARTLIAAVRALNIEKLSLMGSSFGGRLALWFALLAPELVQALVLVAPAALPIKSSAAVQAPGEGAQIQLFAHPERQPVREPLPNEVIQKQRSLVRRIASSSLEPSLEALFGEVTAPVLVLFGTRDLVIPPSQGRVYREKIPNCHLVMVYDAGHAVEEERPDAFVRVVEDFLERHEAFVVNRTSGLINP